MRSGIGGDNLRFEINNKTKNHKTPPIKGGVICFGNKCKIYLKASFKDFPALNFGTTMAGI